MRVMIRIRNLLSSAMPRRPVAAGIRTWQRRPLIVGILLLVGAADFLVGYEVSFLVFYLLPIALGTWWDGRGFALLLSIGCVIIRVAGDLAAGATYSSATVIATNALLQFGFYVITIWGLSRLFVLHRKLENQVRDRTRQILEVSEREHQRIGHDLHDGICQHLTATLLAGQVLVGRLTARQAPETADARHVVGLLEHALAMTRRLSHGLSPFSIEKAGLMQGLEELAATVSEQFRIACRFECDAPVLVPDVTTATHLYRIAQEAISNAIRHGHAKEIRIRLGETESGLCLQVLDNGIGMPPDADRSPGLGRFIMAHRAAIIGASLRFGRAESGGTLLVCSLP